MVDELNQNQIPEKGVPKEPVPEEKMPPLPAESGTSVPPVPRAERPAESTPIPPEAPKPSEALGPEKKPVEETPISPVSPVPPIFPPEPEDMLRETEPKEPTPPTTPAIIPPVALPAKPYPAEKPRRRRWWIFWVILILLAALSAGAWYLWTSLRLPSFVETKQNYSLLYRAATFPYGQATIENNRLKLSLQNMPRLLDQEVYHAYLMRSYYRLEDQGRISEYKQILRHEASLLGSFVLDEQNGLVDAKTNQKISSLSIDPALLEQTNSSTEGVDLKTVIATSAPDQTGQLTSTAPNLKGVTLLSGQLSSSLKADLEFPLVSELEQSSGLVRIEGNQLQVRLNNLPLRGEDLLGLQYAIWLAKFQGPNVVKERQLGILESTQPTVTVRIPDDFRDFDRVVISFEPETDSDPSIYDLKPFEARIE